MIYSDERRFNKTQNLVQNEEKNQVKIHREYVHES